MFGIQWSLRRFWLVTFMSFVVTLLIACVAPQTPPVDQEPTQEVMPEETKELDLTPLTLRVGRVPFAGNTAEISTQYMLEEGVLEEIGRRYGYDLDLELRDYGGAPPEIEAIIAGDLDIAGAGAVPTTRAIAEGQPLTLLAVYDGRFNMRLAVPPDSPIDEVADLQGKTVGTFLGGDVHLFLTQVVRAHLGTADLEEVNIRAVNLPSPAAMVEFPQGIDAVTAFGIPFARGKRDGRINALVTNQGVTGEAHKLGAGEIPPEFQSSPFYPESYVFHRAVWSVRTPLLEEHPDAIAAFLEALQQSLLRAKDLGAAEASQLVREYWELDPEVGADVVEENLLWHRDWIWLTEGDIRGLARNQELMVEAGMLDEAMSFEEFKENLEALVPIAEKAWNAAGYPEHSAFTVEPEIGGVEDIRGLPVWKLDQWQ